MLDQTSERFREEFLLKLVEELLRNTVAYHDAMMQNEVFHVIQGREKEKPKPRLIPMAIPVQLPEPKPVRIKTLIKQKIKDESKKVSDMKKTGLLHQLKKEAAEPFIPMKPKVVRPYVLPPVLQLPEPVLPETVSYIRPVATTQTIDLGRLNILVNDPLVKVIECNGDEKNIVVMGLMGRKATPIKLSKDEIEQVVGAFSDASKIPINEGLFKAAVGDLVISAVISEIVGIQFIIRKII